MPDAVVLAAERDRTGPKVALVAGFLACAGIPLYIHLPRFAAETGISLGVVGLVLLGLRVMDFAQDPLLGWLAARASAYRPVMAAAAIFGLGAGFALVFLVQPGLPGLVAGLVAVFSAFSLGTILFYGQGVALAGKNGNGAHYRLAGWRETGAVAGIVVAALIPSLAGSTSGPLAGYAVLGAAVAVAAPLVWWGSAGLWQARVSRPEMSRPSLRRLAVSGTPWLLGLALLNALPVAVTSTLFVFFVEDRLGLPDLVGVYLVLFFLSAGATAPVWSRLAARFGARRVLLPAMVVAILSFAWAAALPAGSAVAFAAIVMISGAALGADMVILPALFASTLARSGASPELGFGAWAFAGKLSLALAAGIALPVLQAAGFNPGQPNDERAISALNAAYAVVPLALKLPAIWMVARLPEETL